MLPINGQSVRGRRNAEKSQRKRLYPYCSAEIKHKKPWDYDKELYKRRNEVERYFLRIERFRKVFTRYDKLDSSYSAVVYLAMIFMGLLY